MIINIFWLMIVFIMISTQVYLLSKYISHKNEIFLDNKYASFVNGLLTYLFITFITFLPFLIINLNIFYLVIIFWIKEGGTFIFLLTRERNYFDKNYLKKYIFVVLGAAFITLIWNFGLKQLIQPVEENPSSNFSIIYLFNNVVTKTTLSELWIVKNSFTTLFVSMICVSSVLALMSEFSFSMNIYKKLIGVVMTIVAIILFSYKLPLWQNAEVFIQLFVVLICSRIIQYSRRRYGFVFIITSIASFAFGEHSRLGLWAIVIVTMVVYTFLKKPRSSLFWVMLVSPLLTIEAFKVYQISTILSIILVSFSVFIFVFMLSLQGVRPLQKLNTFFEKYRILVPILLGSIIFIIALVVIFTNNINWSALPTINNSFVYLLDSNTILKWFNLAIYILIFVSLSVNIIFKIINGQRFIRIDYIYMIAWLLLAIIFNPLINAMFSISIFANNVRYVSSLIFLPIIILVVNEGASLIKKKS